MDVEASPDEPENEQQFWQGLENTTNVECVTIGDIDDALRSFFAWTTQYKEHLQSEYDFARCSYKLLDSRLFQTHQDYVRRQVLYVLLQEDDVDVLHFAAAILLFDGRVNEAAFELMQTEGTFSRLVELIRDQRDNDVGLHRMLLELLFEMSRMQKLNRADLATIDDAFVLYLLQMIEELSDDADDPYHYPIIRVLLVLNEQYMCLANEPSTPRSNGPLTNRILKLLSAHGPSYRTFGENLILLLNRESAPSAQLLILKLLYLLFTTSSTYEYFYTNDLHVLVDVIIRNLLDLDPGNNDMGVSDEAMDKQGQRALRHTYLRVLCPLLQNTQLAREDNNYKREEVRRLLYLLVNRSSAHFAPVDETVLRLVIRCRQVEWLREEGDSQDEEMERKLSEVAPKDSDVSKKLLGMSLGAAGVSSLSIVDVSANVTKEKPSVPAPRRNRRKKTNGAGPSLQTSSVEGDVPSQLPLLSVPRIEVSPTTDSPGVALPSDDQPIRGRSPFADDNAEE